MARVPMDTIKLKNYTAFGNTVYHNTVIHKLTSTNGY